MQKAVKKSTFAPKEKTVAAATAETEKAADPEEADAKAESPEKATTTAESEATAAAKTSAASNLDLGKMTIAENKVKDFKTQGRLIYVCFLILLISTSRV